MTINLPNLDDRSYSDLVEEALDLLPRYAPVWTNHNPSDPGITLIELLAYFTEAIVYRANRLTDLDRQVFLDLLTGDVSQQLATNEGLDSKSIHERTAKIVSELKQPQRAVTPADYEALAIRASSEKQSGVMAMRAHCMPRCNLRESAHHRDVKRPGFISVVVVPDRDTSANEMQQLLFLVQEYLEHRSLITTRIRVAPPIYVCISFRVDLGLRDGENPAEVTSRINSAIKRHYDYLPENERGTKGWPFGRNVFISELIDLLEGVEGVHFVRRPSVISLRTHDTSEPLVTRALGFQIGIRSTIGENTLLSGIETIEWDRIDVDSLDRPTAVLLKPYELPRVELQIGEFIDNWHGDTWA